MDYITNFEKMGFGMFIHFGLYSIVGKGEWYLFINPEAKAEEYEKLPDKFVISKNWAKNLVSAAKEAGARYITLTTRHHDGFSLYDTKGLNDYDAPHSACKRDLIKEFTEECHKNGILPVFYHTLLDWHNEDYKKDFPKYVDYLCKSIEILCTEYGKVGGFWFDGMWDKPNEDWQENRIYGIIRKFQPEAMIINNTGLSELGKVGNPELDSVTFERGKPAFVDCSDKHRAGEMCQILNDHWGYAENDCNYKSLKELIENLVECRKYNCNFLLNAGLTANGELSLMDRAVFGEIGKWMKVYGESIYDTVNSGIDTGNDKSFILKKRNEEKYYAVFYNLPMTADPNVTRNEEIKSKLNFTLDKKVTSVKWMDTLKSVPYSQQGNTVSIQPEPFPYGMSYAVRVAEIITC